MIERAAQLEGLTVAGVAPGPDTTAGKDARDSAANVAHAAGLAFGSSVSPAEADTPGLEDNAPRFCAYCGNTGGALVFERRMLPGFRRLRCRDAISCNARQEAAGQLRIDNAASPHVVITTGNSGVVRTDDTQRGPDRGGQSRSAATAGAALTWRSTAA